MNQKSLPPLVLPAYYQIRQKLNQGGMGNIYLAYDSQKQREVVIKIIHPHLADIATFRQRFQQEGEILRQLSHPHIVPFYEAGESESGLFLVMAYVAGYSLRTYLARHAPLSEQEALNYLTQISAALQAVHQAGLIHRDLKPDNLLRTEDGHLYLIDFGITKSSEWALTQTGYPLGTYAYMAPEQLINSRDVTNKVDLYALGVIAFEMLTGRLPFVGNEAEILDGHRFLPPPSLRSLNPQLSAAIEQLVLKLLAKNPLQRFDSAQSFCQTLQTASKEGMLTVLPITGVDLPPLARNTPNNLPALSHPLLGREKEHATIVTLFYTESIRLITLLGVGGIGKSSLALTVAHYLLPAFPDGIYFIDLSPISDHQYVVSAICTVLGVSESKEATLQQTLVKRLQPAKILLLLDNLEHLLESANWISQLLQQCPHLKLLITSREPLQIRGEHQYPLDPLDLPAPDGSPQKLQNSPAVQLFLQKAQAILPDFIPNQTQWLTIAKLCRHLDGLPLAIELAAVWIKILSPEQILNRLENRFQFLRSSGRDLPARQQTLEASIDWSFHLLNSQEQNLFIQLAIFNGGFSLEDAELICQQPTNQLLSLLFSLANKSLLRQQLSSGNTRFSMLESIHQYAWQQLQATSFFPTLQQHYITHYCKVTAQAEIGLRGDEQLKWVNHLEQEYNNLSQALKWAIQNNQSHDALTLSSNLWRFWYIRGYLYEGLNWLHQTLQMPNPPTSSNFAVRAAAANGAGALNYVLGNQETAILFYEQALALRRQIQDKRGITGSLNNLAMVYLYQGLHDQAEPLYQEALHLSQELQDPWAEAMVLNNLGKLALDRGQHLYAQQLYQQGYKLYRQTGDQSNSAGLLANLAEVCRRRGQYEQAIQLAQESLTLFQTLQDQTGAADTLHTLGMIYYDAGNLSAAESVFNQALQIHTKLEYKWGIASVQAGMAAIAFCRKQWVTAHTLCQESLQLNQELAYEEMIITLLLFLAQLALINGDLSSAQDYLKQSWQKAQIVGTNWQMIPPLETAILLAHAMGNWQEVIKICALTNQLRQEMDAPRNLWDAGKIQQTLQDALNQLSPEIVKHLYQIGRNLSLKEAMPTSFLL